MSLRKKFLQNDFETTLQKTERNLSSIKGKLNVYQRKGFVEKPSVALTSNVDKSKSVKDVTRDNYMSEFQFIASPNNTISLVKRIDEQSKTISNLKNLIEYLSNEVVNIKEKQREFENHFLSNSAPSVDSFQRELRSEMESLRNRFEDKSMNRNNSYSNNNDLSRDLKMHKRLITDECDSVRREVDDLNSRICRLEHGINSNLLESKDVSHKYTSIQRDVCKLSDEQYEVTRLTRNKDRQLNKIKEELIKLSDEMYGMKKDLTNRSTDSTKKQSINPRKQQRYNNNNDYSNHSSPDYFKLEKQIKPDYLDDSVILTTLLSDSDIDLSIESLTLDDSSLELSKNKHCKKMYKDGSLTMKQNLNECDVIKDDVNSFLNQHKNLLGNESISDGSLDTDIFSQFNNRDADRFSQSNTELSLNKDLLEFSENLLETEKILDESEDEFQLSLTSSCGDL